MQDILNSSIKKLKNLRIRKTRIIAILLVLSFIVSLDVFWSLRLSGLTMAGDADCAITEHTHDESCQNSEGCPETEHVHSFECYSDETADVETPLDWQKMFKDYPYSGDLCKDLVNIAKMQVGYSESELNFEVDQSGIRHGYTRYGAWYGTPYGDWSAMFVSFCLNFAGADSSKYPYNIGAASMAEMWKKQGRFAPMGEYKPGSGDLVFFKNNTVGIVTDVLSTTMYVICGDEEDSVRRSIMVLNDENIVGWGKISETEFVISEEQTKQPKVKMFSLRTVSEPADLLDYLNEKHGSYFFTLRDINNEPLSKDDNGNYIVIADTGYRFTVSFSCPNGFLPGTYHYEIPDGLLVDGKNGVFVLQDKTNVGSWEVTDEGLVTLHFNDNINDRSDVIISATMGIHFAEQEGPVKISDDISVVVQKPPETEETTKVTKWGKQGNENNTDGKTDANKIYWNVSITGHKDSNIPGSVLSDRVVHEDWTGNHIYTQSDMDAGLRFGVQEPGTDGKWHEWTVYPGDPNLTWTELGWTYTIPETITCRWCSEVKLENDGWVYYVDYTSTPKNEGKVGTVYYLNKVAVDNHYADGSGAFVHVAISGIVDKKGYFTTDADSGAFLWEVNVTVPGRQQGQKAELDWYFIDNINLLNNEGNIVGYIENTAHLSTVTATYNGTIIQVPRLQDATENDVFAWYHSWTNPNNKGEEIHLLSRCQCNEENCRFWNNGCATYWFLDDNGNWITKNFCQCWTATENVTFTFVYKTEDKDVLEKYGELGYKLQNVAALYYRPDGDYDNYAFVTSSQSSVSVPSLIKKELTHDFDGYTANYRVTVNEDKLVLTDGTPFRIHDVMTPTLAYISGSLVITAEDENGNITVLHQDADYTVTYDGTGQQTDSLGNIVHVLDITILNPQPVMYTLDYEATLIMPEQITEGIIYGNSATVTLWGDEIKSNSKEKVYADINIVAKNYKVGMYKTSCLNDGPLAGALFGLFNEHGGLIATDETDAEGHILFETNIIKGIVLREHVLYYMQELRAPEGYRLDETKYWFCFCNETGDYCKIGEEILENTNAVRIPFEQIGKIHSVNHYMYYYLPGTGGIGVYPLIFASVTFIVIPLIYMFIRRRKRERRGVE